MITEIRGIPKWDQVKEDLKRLKPKTKKVWKLREGKPCRLLLFYVTAYFWVSQVKDWLSFQNLSHTCTCACLNSHLSRLQKKPESPLETLEKIFFFKLLTVQMNTCKYLKPAELQDSILIIGNRHYMYRMHAKNKKKGRQQNKHSQTKKALKVSMMNDCVTGWG